MKNKPITHIVVDDLKGLVRRGYTDIDGGQMHYRYWGKGEKTLLLLHMAMSSSDEFSRMMRLLANGFHVVAPDYLGYGESDMPPHQYEIEDYARSVLLFLDSLEISRTIILGHHAGALIAAEIASDSPDRVVGLVLSGMPPECLRDEKERLAQRKRPEMQAIEVSWDGSHLMEYWARANQFGDSVQVCNERALDYFKAGPRGEELHSAAFRYYALDKLKMIKCPTLLICGSKDWLRPGTEIAKQVISNSQSAIIEGGTSLMNRQIPNEVTAAILPFLTSL